MPVAAQGGAMTNEKARLTDKLTVISEGRKQPQQHNDRSAGSTVRAGKRSPLADDLLIGLKAISDYTGIPVRKLTWAHEQGRLPTFRLGKTIYARCSELDATLRASPSVTA